MLSPKHECTQVPREVCHIKFSPPKLIKKPLITKWCLEKEKSGEKESERPREGKSKKLCFPQQEDCPCQQTKQCTRGMRCIANICKSKSSIHFSMTYSIYLVWTENKKMSIFQPKKSCFSSFLLKMDNFCFLILCHHSVSYIGSNLDGIIVFGVFQMIQWT